MALVNFIIWNGSPEIFSIGSFSLRWYGLLFALGFLISQQILYYIFSKEGKPVKDVDTLTIYMIVATLLGARLGHVVFYQPELFIEDPLSILLPFEFYPEFRFTGLQGLASHGATIGILTALWLYARKRKPGQSFLQIVDRIVILVAITGALIRLGNFFNSEIIGKPSNLPWSVAFVHNPTRAIEFDKFVEDVSYLPGDSTLQQSPFQPVKILLTFKNDSTITEERIRTFIESKLNSVFSFNTNVTSHIYQTGDLPYRLGKEGDHYEAVLYTNIIPRHPAQLYESISCLLLFILLYFLWARDKEKLSPGRLFSIFLMVCFGLRFLYEYLKENQVAFEDKLPLNMGQILSIPLFIAGLILFIWTFRKKTEAN
jgi:prolipoprotein diacylglyceryl transferase